MVRHHLPSFPTSFIGRTEEIAELSQLLDNPDCRLLTLVGLGGIGKTRLAVELACCKLGNFADGVYFVPLQPLQSPEQVLAAIIDSLPLQVSDNPQQELLNYLSRKKLLLVLDNFEHVLDSAGLVAEMLATAPQIKVLVTTRETLNLQGEWVRQVNGLTYPDESRTAKDDHYSAVELFARCADRVIGDFSLSVNYEHVVRICDLVEGMPLGIELAAGWLRVMSCQMVVDEIQRSIDILTIDQRDRAERHRSIHAVFDHSWRLLTDEEQAIFRKLSVFWGGFTLDAACHIAGATLKTMTSLVDKSLVRVDENGRYSLHELLRQYSRERLEFEGEDEPVDASHGDYYAGYLQGFESASMGSGLIDALDTIEDDFENIRVAWYWAVANRRFDLLNGAINSLYIYGSMHGNFLERDKLFHYARDYLSPVSGDVSYRVWHRLSVRCYSADEGIRQPVEEVRPAVEAALAVARETDNSEEVAYCLYVLGHVAADLEEDYAAGLVLYQDSLSLFQELDNIFYSNQLLCHVGYCWAFCGQSQRALECFRQAIALARRAHAEPYGLVMLAYAEAYLAYNYDEAEALYREAFRRGHLIGGWRTVSIFMGWFALLLFLKGDFAEVDAVLEKAQQIAEDTNDPDTKGWNATMRGVMEIMRGNYAKGKELCQFGRKSMTQSPHRQLAARWAEAISDYGLGNYPLVLEQMPFLLHRGQEAYIHSIPIVTQALIVGVLMLDHLGQKQWAVRILGGIFTHPDNLIGWLKKWPLIADLCQRLEMELGEAAYATAWNEGRGLNLEQSADELLEFFRVHSLEAQKPVHQMLPDPLTPRELEVLALVAQGRSNQQIADELVISVNTVKRYVYDICQKLDAQNRTEAANRARILKLIE